MTLARPRQWSGPRWAPASATAADKADPRDRERSRGRKKTTAGLAVGGFSGETNGVTVLTKAMRN